MKVIKQTETISYSTAYQIAYQEYNIQKNLDHPNIVRCFGKTQTYCYDDSTNDYVEATVLVLEYVQGGDLIQYLMQDGGFDEKVARFLFIQLLNGLQHIHSKNISHLDLKLDNIFVDGDLDLA